MQNKMLFYESIAENFDSIVNMYDTHKRMRVIFTELLTENIKGKKVLDAGCGTGWVSLIADRRGAKVTSMDVGPELLKQVKKKCNSICVVGSILEMPFKNESFDVVISTEVIEHVTNPHKAIKEMYRVLKPGGVLVVTTPNKFWHWSVQIANKLNLRKYQGLENWLAWDELGRSLIKAGFSIQKMRGLHTFPFTVSAAHSTLDYLDQYHEFIDPYMINTCVRAIKRQHETKK